MYKNTLYIMCGAPGAGKSTFAKKWFQKNQNIKYISRDEIRFKLVKENEPYFSREKEVWNIFIQSIQLALDEGFDVIADATHLNKISRFKLYSHLNMNNTIAAAVVIPATLETCIAHNEARKGTRSYVPERVLINMYYKFIYPDLENELYLYAVYNVGAEGHVSKIIR